MDKNLVLLTVMYFGIVSQLRPVNDVSWLLEFTFLIKFVYCFVHFSFVSMTTPRYTEVRQDQIFNNLQVSPF